MIDGPALHPKQLSNLAVAIPAIPLGQSDHRQTQRAIVILVMCNVALGTPSKANRFAGSPLRRIQLLANMDHCLTKIGNRQAFGFK
jgi:hypothetical protein